MATFNAGGLYSPMIPNCTCIYKYDDFYRSNPNHINLPGANFYSYSTHPTGEVPQSGDPQVPDWKCENSRLYATYSNPQLSWRSTIPLGVVFFYGIDDLEDMGEFTIKFSSNDTYIQHQYTKTENDSWSWRLDITDSSNVSHAVSGFTPGGTIAFTEYNTSEDVFKNFAVHGYKYYLPTQAGSGEFNYSIELQNASTGCYISSLVLQRNTLECLNLNNENTRLLPNQIMYPTGYLSIPYRFACDNSLQTVFGIDSTISFMKDRYFPFTGLGVGFGDIQYGRFEDGNYYIGEVESNYKQPYTRNGFLKSHNINNNYCQACYELTDKFIQIKSNIDEEISRLNTLIDNKTQEIEQAGDNPIVLIDELNKLEEEKTLVLNIKNFDSVAWSNWYNSNFNANLNDFSNTAENIIPHNRGINLPHKNPCLSENPKVTINIENGIIDTGAAYKITFDKDGRLRVPLSTSLYSSSEPELIEFDDIDISGTYELLTFSRQEVGGWVSDLFYYAFPVRLENDYDFVNIYIILEARVGINYIDMENGIKRHYAKFTIHWMNANKQNFNEEELERWAYLVISGNAVSSYSGPWTLVEFVENEWMNSLSDICQNSHNIEILAPNFVSEMRYINNRNPECGDFVYAQGYTKLADFGCRDCGSTGPLVSQEVFAAGASTGILDNDGLNSCSDMNEVLEESGIVGPVLGGHYTVSWKYLTYNYRACDKMKITIEAE